MANFFALVREVAERQPAALCFAVSGQSYGAVWRRVQYRAAALRARGLKKGDVLGILSKNSPDWCVTFTAAMGLGVLALVLDTNLSSATHREMLAHVQAKLVCVSPEFAAVDYGIPQYAIEMADPAAVFEPEPVDDADLAALFYTSGTTGEPKVVPLTQANLLKTTLACIERFHAVPSDMFMTILPLYHVYGLVAGFLGAYLSGASIVFQNSLKASDILGTLARQPITIFSAVPQLWEIFLDRLLKKIKSESPPKHAFFVFVLNNAPSLRHLGLGRLLDKLFYPVHQVFGLKLRLLISGGSRLRLRYCLYYKRLGFNLTEGYGLTETTGPICVGKIKNATPICVGLPLPGNQVAIRQPDKHGIGEIWLKGDAVMPGYYQNPEATREAFDADGWFQTGDLGLLDRHGELHIRGRSKNVIVLDSGKNVYPEDIESRYLQSPLVEEIAIFGRRISSRETVYAVVVPAEKNQDSREQLKAEFKKLGHGLPTYKRIGRFAVSFNPLPRTSTQKVKVHEVIQRLEAGEYQAAD
ncbi:long-chain-fatty-acid--CoA ligase [Candidatus Termititenax persephonae]|uniref:Long-chain-fatty-acid--CoA ligase n=1 Tax=Candidatus Termititenax persephonae TaxID=2218525 RepID=A0A388TIA7_9BACT|nr:long-chain-fatty-acid--CoA ligase [Candidatus Termititenax persephonae]